MGIFLVCFAVTLEEEIWDIIGEGRGKVKYFKPLPKNLQLRNPLSKASQFLNTGPQPPPALGTLRHALHQGISMPSYRKKRPLSLSLNFSTRDRIP
jgi:hypothetical protein